MNGNRIPDNIRESFEEIPVVDKDGYSYFVHPLSDGIFRIEPELLGSFTGLVVDAMKGLQRPSLLLTAEAMGIPITSTVSIRTGIPFAIARKRSYGLDGEIEVEQSTGYSSTSLFLNMPAGPGKVMIIDDVLSTGGTLRSMAAGLGRSEKDIIASLVLFNKMGDGSQDLSEELGIPVITLFDVEIIGNECLITMSPARERR